VRARLGAIESRVESFAASAASRLSDLARQEASGEQLRDLLRIFRTLLPAFRDRLATLAGLGSLFLSSGEIDAYGLDRDLAEGVAPIIDFLYGSWWRVDARDAERVPAEGPVVLVANHGGVLPWDALVLRTALRRDHPARRDLRPLLDEHALGRRISGTLARRLGAVAATPENASQLLEQGGAIAVFPEGSRGSTRPWADRYRIQRFGRGGFARLAVRLGATIVPCAIVGSEETALPMARAGWLSSTLGMPFLTSPPPLPFVPLGVLPLPARWSLRFGAPIETASMGSEAAGDATRVLELTEHVRSSLQQLLDEDVVARRSVYL
jgi:1-acyl-sn-glycerol-3-phosphate acyltransferase